MEKRLYELKTNEALEHVMPPLQEMELTLLTQSLLTEGCRDSLVIWKETGELVDGHNRYRICQENNIPFKYIDMSFEDETAAKHWIIKNQLSRRNVPPFVRCELVLPLEEELKAEAKKRQGQRNDLSNIVPNLAQSSRSRDELAQMAGVSHGTMDKARKLAESADEETLEKLRNGDISIHRAYTALEQKSGPENKITRLPGCGKNDKPKKNPGDLVPGFGIHEILENSRLKTGYMPPPDDVVAAFEEAEERRKKLWENADMAIIEGEMRSAMEYFVARVGDITSMMKPELRTSENIEKLKAILMDTVDQITEIIDSAKKGE